MAQIAFEITKQLKKQSIVFVYDCNNKPKIIEICFGFSIEAYDNCDVYWNRDFQIIEKKINLQSEMIKNFNNSNFQNDN